MLKVGLVGAGGMGAVHAAALAGMRGAKLVGVVDAREEAARRLVEQAGVAHYTSLDELVSAENPNLIDICLPTDLHKEYAVRAAELGKHVFCEKPMARSSEEAQAMVEACRKAGVKLMIGHVLRFSPEYRTAKQMVEDGRLGRVGTVRMIREGAAPGWSAWFGDNKRSGGVLLDLAIHDMDWLRWTFGEAERVYAKLAGTEQGLPGEHAVVSIRMKSGVIAHITGSWAQPDGFRTFLELAGTGGVAKFDSADTYSIKTTLRGEERLTHQLESPLEPDGYFHELQHFIDCIASGTEPSVNGEDAAQSLELALAAIRSAETGQVVFLS
ncbi:Gfo/Idh/MocA family protein [Cohnella pontilimi]|nr:Gfo/Idh/MocA family oxidoreductase [Cohnella pontilimi]